MDSWSREEQLFHTLGISSKQFFMSFSFDNEKHPNNSPMKNITTRCERVSPLNYWTDSMAFNGGGKVVDHFDVVASRKRWRRWKRGKVLSSKFSPRAFVPWSGMLIVSEVSFLIWPEGHRVYRCLRGYDEGCLTFCFLFSLGWRRLGLDFEIHDCICVRFALIILPFPRA